MKINKILNPIVLNIFQEIIKNSRNEIIEILEQSPGI